MKKLINLISELLVFPMIFTWRIYYLLVKRELLFVSYAQFLALIPGKIGIYLRRAYYHAIIKECGENISIGFGTFFSHPTVELGDNIYIGSGCTIGTTTIGDGTMIGSNVDILSGRRQHSRNESGELIGADAGVFERIYIGNNSWIGNGSIVMANIGGCCTVGAGSVVVKEVLDNDTVVGNPASSISYKKK